MTKTADICDAHKDVQVCHCQFLTLGSIRSFSGRIRTVRCEQDIVLVKKVLSENGAGCVLVVDGGGSLARAIFGDNMALLAIDHGWAGVVINGAVRDSAEIDAMDIGVKVLGLIPMRPERSGRGEADVPLRFGDADFEPGRWLVADEDGVILLPPRMSGVPHLE